MHRERDEDANTRSSSGPEATASLETKDERISDLHREIICASDSRYLPKLLKPQETPFQLLWRPPTLSGVGNHRRGSNSYGAGCTNRFHVSPHNPDTA